MTLPEMLKAVNSPLNQITAARLVELLAPALHGIGLSGASTPY
jgi:hypothetical protein